MDTILDFRASQSLSLEGLRNEISRQIQVARKDANCDIQERVAVVFTSRDEFVLAAARLNTQYLLNECLLDTFVVMEGENHVQLRGKTYEYSLKKWHSPCKIENGEVYYGGNEYPHYWAAVYSMYNDSNESNSNESGSS